MMQDIILATSNPGKIRELTALLQPLQCFSQDQLLIPSIAETGLSFFENALIKARNASYHGQKPALADDSGLVVPALGGAPGIYSARFAGSNANDQENIDYLLEQMSSLSGEKRQAYFYCALVLVRFAEDPIPLFAFGKIKGQILNHAQGNHGFGYDPVFYLTEYGCTAAEIPAEVKNKISHRALALQELRQQLREEECI